MITERNFSIGKVERKKSLNLYKKEKEKRKIFTNESIQSSPKAKIIFDF